MLRYALFLAALFSISAHSQEVSQEIVTQAASPRKACIRDAYLMDSDVQQVLTRTGNPFGEMTPKFDRLSDSGKPSKAERAAIKRLGNALDRCLAIPDQSMEAPHPRIAAVVDQLYLSTRVNLAALSMGKTSFGEFYASQSEAVRKYNSSLDAMADEVRAREAQEERQRQAVNRAAQEQSQIEAASAQARRDQERARLEYERKVAELQEAQRRSDDQRAFMNGMMLFQQSLPRPTPSISCTSRNAFGTVYTDCR